MNKEFVPYEEALALKELGFDEECFYYHSMGSDDTTRLVNAEKYIKPNSDIYAPLYQQAFRWFRENFNMHFDIVKCGGGHNNYKIERNAKVSYNTYQEAQDECLRKLIEIVKEKL